MPNGMPGAMPVEADPPRRVLLTGADGFVGRHLRAALAAAYPDATLLTGRIDLRDGAAVTAAVVDANPDVCVHLAAIATLAAARADEDHAWDVNLHGSLRLARALLRHAPDCQMLFVSSADAYGGGTGVGGDGGVGTPIGEDTPLAPKNLYAATKAAADLALGAMAQQGLRVVRARPFNHTGPGQSADLVIPAFARQVARIAAGLQPPLMRVGNLDTWRDFLDVRDVCAAYVACIDRRAALAPGLIVNIGSGRALRIGDMLAELMALAGVAAEARTDAARARAGDVARAVADPARARALLGWAPAIPWSRTLADVLDDWRGRVGDEPADG
jgi:GDP-4-dehydro-6-deoxy-D-mannose reductase